MSDSNISVGIARAATILSSVDLILRLIILIFIFIFIGLGLLVRLRVPIVIAPLLVTLGFIVINMISMVMTN